MLFRYSVQRCSTTSTMEEVHKSIIKLLSSSNSLEYYPAHTQINSSSHVSLYFFISCIFLGGRAARVVMGFGCLLPAIVVRGSIRGNEILFGRSVIVVA